MNTAEKMLRETEQKDFAELVMNEIKVRNTKGHYKSKRAKKACYILANLSPEKYQIIIDIISNMKKRYKLYNYRSLASKIVEVTARRIADGVDPV